MQAKAYRSNQPSLTSYVERGGKSLLNFQVVPFNIITAKDETQKVDDRRPMTTIYNGKCRGQHPLSHFVHQTRATAPNHSQDYQKAVGDNA